MVDQGGTQPEPRRGASAVVVAIAVVGVLALVAAVIGVSGLLDGTSADREPDSTIATSAAPTAPDTVAVTVPPTVPAATPTVPEAAPTTVSDGPERPVVILDTDTNNELDDQFALAYLLLSERVDVQGITVNQTRLGGPIEQHVAEAERIVRMVGKAGQVPILAGASGGFAEIADEVGGDDFDGRSAVDFIVETVRGSEADVVVIAIGKLTNVALALRRDPTIVDGMRVLWLGSNYPDAGLEYNLENDVAAVRAVLDSAVDLEIAVVRPGQPDGTAAILVTPDEIRTELAGAGPAIAAPVVGRDGEEYTTFGDYAVALMDDAELFGDPPSRSLFDVGAVAVAIDSGRADLTFVPSPTIGDDLVWVARPDNPRSIRIRSNFDRTAILDDLYATITGADG